MTVASPQDSTRDSRLWHPFADMGTVRSNELMITRADDVWVWDDQGRRYLDAFASLWYVNIGHGRREIADAVHAQLCELDSYTVFFDYANPPASRLAERLADLSGLEGARVFLGSGGGDAVETAAKVARRYFAETGASERTHIISREQCYHGTHGFGTSLGGITANVGGWGALVPDTSRVAYDSVEALEAEILRVGPERVAAFFCEPVIGAGGVLLPPEGYIEGVAALCREHGILFVCDAVICGFGRLGTWFGYERWSVQPDMIVFAKGVTSGYQPLGGLIVSGRVAEPFWGRPGSPALRHGPTWSGHPACCAAALVNLDVIEREGLLDRARDLEGELEAALAPLASNPAVGELRAGLGVLAAVELSPDLIADVPDAGQRMVAGMRERGVLVRALDAATVAVSPPLTLRDEHARLIADAFEGTLAELAAPALPGAAS